jgi:hypothetical protein
MDAVAITHPEAIHEVVDPDAEPEADATPA